MEEKKKAGAVTIGCRLNQADTALMFDRLEKAGYEIAGADCGARLDLIVVNTCAVTAAAVKKSRQAVRKYRRLHPESVIVAAGCASETEKDLWRNDPFVDFAIGNEDKKNLMEILGGRILKKASEQEDERKKPDVFFEDARGVFPFRHRAFVKVQEGCDSFCSYCIVPHARGRERSRDWDEIKAEFKAHVRDGVKEMVVTGVNTSAYSHKGRGLADLLEELASIEGDFRIRIGSTEPHKENIRVLKAMVAAPEKICRFLHLPLQHGSDEVLRLMNRKYTVAEFFDFVARARDASPLIHIGTDMIVGFPGETEELFRKSCEAVERLGFANTHMFPYSPRKGTPAFDFSGRPPGNVVAERLAALESISRRAAVSYARRNLNSRLGVLIEEDKGGGVLEGWSDNYLRMSVKGDGHGLNEFANVVAVELDEDTLILR